ncbi:MAG: hypothetical protein DHS20C15_34660 [Planctomycetota bacterium]|nr:MAG: hypothetical protein DHS20C15_34660 [Planctomycetota bacterium]
MDVALLDILALIVIVAGLLQGLMRGLGPSFGLLLWLILALWLSNALAPQVISWMPNSGDPSDPEAVATAYAWLAALLVLLPAVAQLLGGSGGKKKVDPEATNKFSAVIVGVVSSLLLLAWLTPYTQGVDALSEDLDSAYTPGVVTGVASAASWLYPEAHREELRALAAASKAPDASGTAK